MELKEVTIKKIIHDGGIIQATQEPWESTSIVVETENSRITDSACVKLNKKVVDGLKATNTILAEGDTVDLWLGVEARPYNDKNEKVRYSNELYAWKLEHSTF